MADVHLSGRICDRRFAHPSVVLDDTRASAAIKHMHVKSTFWWTIEFGQLGGEHELSQARTLEQRLLGICGEAKRKTFDTGMCV